MKKILRAIGCFALVGFLVPLPLFGLDYCARLLKATADLSEVFLLLCPPSIQSMALDNAPREMAIEVWLVIAVENAILYGIVGAIVGLFLRVIRLIRDVTKNDLHS
ncbi:MAG: hypothetical protein ACYCOR_16410 [Acidobacteriaceae bacterium]